MPSTALEGVRVLDLAGEPAALAGRILADLGAEVILVEPPEGNRTRWLAPFLGDAAGEEQSYAHLYFNANKRSVTLDVKDDATKFLALAGTADVVIESAHPGALDALGIGFEALKAANAGIILVSVTPYGQEGPKRDWKGTDLTALAAGGMLQVCGEADDPPAKGPAKPAYSMAGLMAAAGSMMALHGRRTQPESPAAHIDVSLQEATMAALVQTSNPNNYLWRGEVPVRPALSQAMLCADGKWAAANILGNRIEGFIAMLDEVGVEHSLTPENWMDMQSPSGAWLFLENPIQYLAMEAAAKLTRDEFLNGIWEAGSAGMPIYSFPEMAKSEHYISTNQFRPVENEPLGETLSFVRGPVDAVEPDASIERAPIKGEHTSDILGGLSKQTPRPASASASSPAAGAWMPLAGVRVVDFCWVAAGPYGTSILADFGAEVIKVESSIRMDSLRNQLLPDGEHHFDLPDLFNDVNTGKKSVTLDLSTAEGKEVARKLIDTADVVTNNYTAGSLRRMGFKYEELKERNPGLVVLHLPGFGGDSPWVSHRSLGNLLMAASGLNYLTGFPDRPPRGIGLAYPDFTTPFLTVSTVLACLNERSRTGLGREMELSQLSATVSLLGAEWMQYEKTKEQPPRPGNRDPNHAPHGVYPSAGPDRWVAVAVEDDEQWGRLASLIGGTSLSSDERFATHAARKDNEDALDDLVAGWTRDRDRWRVAEQLQQLGIAASAVEDLRDLMDSDPISRSHYQRVFQPSSPDFEIAIDAEPVRFVGETRVLRRSPTLGEHNEEVLRGVLGMDDEEIANLVVTGVIA